MGHSTRAALSRRRLLQGTAAGLFGAGGAAVLAACGESQVVEKIVTVTVTEVKEVVKEVPVETVVTKEIIKEVPVETVVTKEIIKEVPVETVKEVEVEKVVTVTEVKEVVKEVEVPTSVEAGQPVRGGDLRMSWGGPLAAASFNSYTQIASDQAVVNEQVDEFLINGASWGDGPLPTLERRFADAIAKSFEEVRPEESYIFHLDERYTFHDGAPVTADDFMYTFHIVTHPDWGVGYGARQLNALKGIEAWAENPTESIEDSGGVTKIDEMTIQLTTDGPNEAFWQSPNPMPPLPKHVYEPLDPATAFDTMALQPLGTGPFKFVRYLDQQFAELARHDAYPHGAPWVDRYIARYGDPDALNAAAEAGELDFLRTGSVETYARLSGMQHMQAQPMRTPFGNLIFLNHSVFADKWPDVNVSLMTEAMVRGADRDSIATELKAGTIFPDDYIFSHIRFMADPPADAWRPLPYNEEEASALLEESGWNPNDTLKWLTWFQPGPEHIALQANWKAMGLNVEFDVIDRAAVVEHLWETGANDMVMANLGGSQDFKDYFLRLGCDKIYPNGYNYHHDCHPELEALHQAGLDAGSDKEALREAWEDISRWLHGRGTMVAGQLWRGSLLFLYHRRVNGPFWMNNYAVPVDRPSHRVYLDPRWDGRDYTG